MKQLIDLIKKENGNVLVLVSFSFAAFLALAGVIIDGGTLYMTKTHLQKTANAAVLSGAQELTSSDAEVEAIVDQILLEHKETDSKHNLIINQNESVKIILKKSVPLAFSKLFGVDSVDVNVNSTASIGYMSRAVGAAPLGVDQSTALNYGDIHSLKVGPDDADTGNFGILALDGPGAKTYEDTLMNGLDEELKVGDIVNTQTGNIADKTRSSVDYLVDTCVSEDERYCPRVLLVPVYAPYNYDGGQMKQVEITGFAYFYILEKMNSNDTSIKGKFLKRTGTGFADGGAVDRGAYTIRLSE